MVTTHHHSSSPRVWKPSLLPFSKTRMPTLPNTREKIRYTKMISFSPARLETRPSSASM